MKNSILFGCSFFLFLVSINATAQKKDNFPFSVIEYKGDIIQQQRSIVNTPSAQVVNQQAAVTQIGNNNTIITAVQTIGEKDLDYTQIGDTNNIQVISQNTNARQMIHQQGNQNNYDFYNYNSFEQQNIQVIQNGNKQNIEVFGENSLSKDMKIIMNASDQSLIIRNFN